MLSLFPRPNKFTLQVRKDHIQARDRALCVPLSEEKTKSVDCLSDLHPSEIQLQDGDLDILSCQLQDLVRGITERRWTSTRILHAFVRSARRAHQNINCITVPNFIAAIKIAKERDDHFERTGELVGPLHGVPFSFKENNNIKGLTTTVGYTAWVLDGPATADGALAQMVQHLGGIIILKTNIPQTMMSFECANPLYGRTSNPWSAAHTPGGSSGGEAAVLASDGAAAGIGSDIGGSLRIPASYCGIYALKPTIGRLPTTGTRGALRGFEGIPAVYAQMCRSAADLEYLLRELIPLLHPPPDSVVEPYQAQRSFGCAPLRPSPLRTAWFNPVKASEERGKPLRIGYYYCDGYVKTSPACIRGVKESIEALRASPAFKEGKLELIEIDPARLNTVQALYIFTSLVTADRFSNLLRPLKRGNIREPMEPALFLPVLSARGPRWLTKILYWVVNYVVGDKTLGGVMTAGGGKSATRYYELVATRDDFRAAFRKNIWDHYQLDGIVCPTQASPAIPHGGCTKLSSMAASTILYNVLDLPVTICPVTRVDAKRDSVLLPLLPTREEETKDPSSCSTPLLASQKEWNATPGFETTSYLNNKTLYGDKIYDAEKMHGLPVGVQIVTKEFEEEKSIGLLRVLDEALKDVVRKRNVKGANGKEDQFKRLEWGPGLFTRLTLGRRKEEEDAEEENGLAKV